MQTLGYLKDDEKELIGCKECTCLLDTFTEGNRAQFVINGKSITRRVYWDKHNGLNVSIKGYSISFEDFE